MRYLLFILCLISFSLTAQEVKIVTTIEEAKALSFGDMYIVQPGGKSFTLEVDSKLTADEQVDAFRKLCEPFHEAVDAKFLNQKSILELNLTSRSKEILSCLMTSGTVDFKARAFTLEDYAAFGKEVGLKVKGTEAQRIAILQNWYNENF